MKKIKFIILACIGFTILCGHDMFLKLDAYHLQPNTQAVLQLFNGTFNKSDNSIERNRMLDVSLVGNGKRIAVDSSDWFDKNKTTYLNFKTGNEGTWVAGLSTKARDFEMEAEAFNKYLKTDGVFDILENRKTNNTLNNDAVEKYAKHVKTIFQVGHKRTDDYKVNLGYPIEFIPLQNPYNVHAGHSIDLRLLYNGKPLKNHFVYVGSDADKKKEDHSHSHDGGEAHSHENDNGEKEAHVHPETEQYKTNQEGIVSININSAGTWFVRTIKMIKSKDPKLTHESNWATLTFGIGASHDDHHNHDHPHKTESQSQKADTHSHDGEAHAHNSEAHNHDANTHSKEGEAHTHNGVTHSHDDDTHQHDDHEHDEEFPTALFWIASALIVGILFFWFNRKK